MAIPLSYFHMILQKTSTEVKFSEINVFTRFPNLKKNNNFLRHTKINVNEHALSIANLFLLDALPLM